MVCQSTNKKDNRLRTSILIKNRNCNILIDIGPDFRTQMLQTNTKQIETILKQMLKNILLLF